MLASAATLKPPKPVHAGGRSRTKAPLRQGQGNGAIGTSVAVQEEVEYGLVSIE